MTLTTTPAPARTDVPTAPRRRPAPPVRRAGFAVAAGAADLGRRASATVGPQTTDPVGIMVSDLSALPFQLGLFVLVTAQLRTLATGTSRWPAGMLRVEYVLLVLATLWTVLHGLVPSLRDDAWLAVLDLFWPLSMLGMFVIGVKIAVAGRWRGAARFWPLGRRELGGRHACPRWPSSAPPAGQYRRRRPPARRLRRPGPDPRLPPAPHPPLSSFRRNPPRSPS